MTKESKIKILKHVCAVAVMALITLVYFKPLLNGEDVRQSDMMFFEGMSKELKDYHATTGEYSYWTNAMFSGMPAAYLYAKPDANVFWWMGLPIQKGTPMMSFGIVFMLLLCFYIAMCQLDVHPVIAFAAALAYAFCSYNLIIIEAGHVTKAYTIATIPLVVSGVVLAYRNKRLAGGLIFMIGFGFSLAQSHPQITYYTGIAVAVYAIVALAYAIARRTIPNFLKSSAVLVIAGILAILPNISNLYTSYDYSKESMRGKSELAAKSADSGLDYDYAYAWSYGKGETFTLLVPNACGGSSSMESMEAFEQALPNTLNTLRTVPMEQDPNQLVQQCNTYWGAQPFTSGPVYAGAVVCLLFVLSMFFIKGEMRTWAIILFVCSIVFAWGKHCPAVNDFMFYHFPMFNKFRTPSMILVLTTFVMVFFGFYGLKQLFNADADRQAMKKSLYIAAGIVGGITFIMAVMPTLFFNFTVERDASLPAALQSALADDRKALLVHDAWRSFLFIAMAFVVLWVAVNKKIKAEKAILLLGVLALIDLWGVDKRYLNDNDFEKHDQAVSQQYAVTPCDAAIMQDKTPGYRVLNLAANPFTDTHVSYFHHSLGGYHGAKLRRYQEFVDSVMMYDLNHFTTQINMVRSDSDMLALTSSLQSLNMLNAKYFIFNYQSAPFVNESVYGPAWIVNDVQWAKNANEELAMTKCANTRTTAVIDEQFKSLLADYTSGEVSQSSIRMTGQTSNTCTYKVKAERNVLAVFSEIYYPKYWKVSIDGKETNGLLRADYILRAMVVPQGEHEIKFEFYPSSWFVARNISMISSILIILIILGIVGYKVVYLPRKKAVSEA